MEIKLTTQRLRRIMVGEIEQVKIVLVGCGGTGSFVALHLARLAYHAHEQRQLPVSLTFIDPDIVEHKNIGRQNFSPVEIGAAKAWTLMRRYNAAFGLQIKAIVDGVENYTQMYRNNGKDLCIVVGCVDNAAARRSIASRAPAYQFWWLDCGNAEHAGQVLLGNRYDLEKPELTLDFCSGLPLPSIQHPELLVDDPVEKMAESCAELTLRDAQSLMVNQAVATFASQYLYRLILSQDLDIYATYFDLVSGSARSLPILTEEQEENRD